MRDDILVYISGPITPKNGYTEMQNAQCGIGIYMKLLKAGIPAFLPHLNCFMSEEQKQELGYERFMAYDFAIIKRCTHFLLLDRWKTSSGTLRELDFAAHCGLPIYEDVDFLISTIGPSLTSNFTGTSL